MPMRSVLAFPRLLHWSPLRRQISTNYNRVLGRNINPALATRLAEGAWCTICVVSDLLL